MLTTRHYIYYTIIYLVIYTYLAIAFNPNYRPGLKEVDLTYTGHLEISNVVVKGYTYPDRKTPYVVNSIDNLEKMYSNHYVIPKQFFKIGLGKISRVVVTVSYENKSEIDTLIIIEKDPEKTVFLDHPDLKTGNQLPANWQTETKGYNPTINNMFYSLLFTALLVLTARLFGHDIAKPKNSR